MTYNNSDPRGVEAFERARTGNYGNNEEEAVTHCDLCGEPIYYDERYYNIGELIVCQSCVKDGERSAWDWE
jgi:hypothetical protein